MSSDAAHPNTEIASRLQKIYALHKTEIDLRLEKSPYLTLLEKLGDPHKKLPPCIHIAGTNGKGSTLAFLRAMLEAAGYKVHAYTSPHLITFNERIRLAGTLITDAELIRLYDHIETVNASAPITFFEYTTALAFVAMSEVPADICLLETGMGGRLDCTNVIENPALTIITKISFDHMEFLGDTLPKIAAEKAGIMKKSVPCIIGPQMNPDAVMPIFEQTAKEKNAELIIVENCHCEEAARPTRQSTNRMDCFALLAMTKILNFVPSCLRGKNIFSKKHFTFNGKTYPTPNLTGAHQIENAKTALAAIEILTAKIPFKIPEAAKIQGLTHTDWPARLQRISESPEIWFDAAHNDSGAQALAAQFKTWKTQEPRTQIHLIVGLAADKDAAAFFAPLNGLYDSLTLVDLPEARKPQTANQLKEKINMGKTAENLTEALKTLPASPPNHTKICIAGSLYLYQAAVINLNTLD